MQGSGFSRSQRAGTRPAAPDTSASCPTSRKGIPRRRHRQRARRCPPPCARAPSYSRRRTTERWPSGRRRTPGKCVGGKPPRGFESRSLRHLHIANPKRGPLWGLFSFCFKGVCRCHPTFRDWRFRRNRSLNAPGLFPSALCQNRDGFKRSYDFSMLAESKCAAVEAGSSALGTNRDTRRRRGRAGLWAFRRRLCRAFG